METSNTNVIQVTKPSLGYIQFRKLLEYPELIHAYTMSYHAFGISGNDNYQQNKDLPEYEQLAKELGIDIHTMIRPFQTHTNVVKTIEQKQEGIQIFPENLQQVDGLVTKKEKLFLVLSYADCIPIFLYDSKKKVIGNVHSRLERNCTKNCKSSCRKNGKRI